MKKKAFMAIIFVFSCILVTSLLEKKFWMAKNGFRTPENGISKSSYPDHAAINIPNEGQLTAFADKTGSGTLLDPYIIQNYTVQPGNLWEGDFYTCVYLHDISSYLKLVNLVLNDTNVTSSSDWKSANMIIENCTNIELINCTFYNASNCSKNLHILDYSESIDITNCTFNGETMNNSHGFQTNAIYLNDSFDITINNTIINDTYNGIAIDNTSDSTILDSEIYSCELYGIVSQTRAVNITILNNSIYYCNIGMYFTVLDDYIYIYNNTIYKTWQGDAIKISGGLDVAEIINNTIHDVAFELEGADASGINIVGEPEDIIIQNNTIYNSAFGITISTNAENITVIDNHIYSNEKGLVLSNTNYDLNFTGNLIENNDLAIEDSGLQDPANFTGNLFKDNTVLINFLEAPTVENYDFTGNAFYDYFDYYPNDTVDAFGSVTLESDYTIYEGIIDEEPWYYEEWYFNERNLYISYFSTFDYFGFEFNKVKTFIDGVQIASDSITLEEQIFRLTVRDYANVKLYDELHNINASLYLNIGLDVAEIEFFNNGTIEAILTIERNEVSTQFQIAPGTSRRAWLSAGDYEYVVEDPDGEVQIDSEFTVDGSKTLNIGWVVLEVEEEPPTEPLDPTELVLTLIGIIGGTAVIILVVAYFTRPANPNRKPASTERTRSIRPIGRR